jgi:hypothetical protein
VLALSSTRIVALRANIGRPPGPDGIDQLLDRALPAFRGGAPGYPAFFDRAAGARTGFTAFFGSGFAVSFAGSLSSPWRRVCRHR